MSVAADGWREREGGREREEEKERGGERKNRIVSRYISYRKDEKYVKIVCSEEELGKDKRRRNRKNRIKVIIRKKG